jgi:DNA-binding transcriptional MerR regulator
VSGLTVSELSERLGVPENTLRRYCKIYDGWLCSRKIGRGIKYDEESLDVLARIRDWYGEGKIREDIEELLGDKSFMDVEDDGDGKLVVKSGGSGLVGMSEFIKVMDRMVVVMEKQGDLEDEMRRLRMKVEEMEREKKVDKQGWFKSLFLKGKGDGDSE